MDPRQERLSNVIDGVAPNFLTDWLKAPPDQEPGMIDRLKSAIEYAGLDIGVQGVARLLKAVKAGIAGASASAEGQTPPTQPDQVPAEPLGQRGRKASETTADGVSRASDAGPAETGASSNSASGQSREGNVGPTAGQLVPGDAESASRSVGQRILDFVLRRRENPSAPYERTEIMPVGPDEAERVKNETGLDIAGRQHVIASDYLQHIERRHGPLSGDRTPLTEDDYQLLPELISNPDQVTMSPKLHLGMPVIEYRKQIGDLYIAAEFVRPKAKELVLLSYLKRPGWSDAAGNRRPPEP
jgi:hypothetical protein